VKAAPPAAALPAEEKADDTAYGAEEEAAVAASGMAPMVAEQEKEPVKPRETIRFSTKRFPMPPSTLTLDGEKAVQTVKNCCGCVASVEVAIRDVRYFDVGRHDGLMGLFAGTGIRFGYQEQIQMYGLTKEEIETIRKHLEDYGAKLGTGAQWYSKGIDCCCCETERLAVVDDGVMYRWKKGGQNESTFVAWDKINIAIFPGLFCGRSVTLLGELDIATHRKFPLALINKIKEGIQAHGIGESEGKVYRPPIWEFQEHFKSSLVLTDTGVVAKLSPRCVSESELPQNSKKGSGRTIFIPYETITKIGNAKGLKGYFRIEGTIEDLRSGEPARIVLVMMKPIFWCLLKCKIKGKM
jgi:hypothetical protein